MSSGSFLNYIYVLSTIYVAVKILCFLWILFKNYILPYCRAAPDFKKYGQWAVITGCTDGIGKGFAKELASKGVDICLVSRNEEKLIATAKEIELNYGVKTKYIVADFTSTDVYDNIRANLEGLDIGILVNNVGIITDGLEPMSAQDEKMIRDCINVNIFPLTLITSIVLPCMIAKNRGLIVNLSSLLGVIAFPNVTVYCGTKAYVSMFGTCLSYELKKHNIQMTTLTTGMVTTKLLEKFSNMEKLCKKLFPFFVLSVDQFVTRALSSVTSGSSLIAGSISIEIYGAIGKLLPTGLVSWATTKLNNLTMKK